MHPAIRRAITIASLCIRVLGSVKRRTICDAELPSATPGFRGGRSLLPGTPARPGAAATPAAALFDQPGGVAPPQGHTPTLFAGSLRQPGAEDLPPLPQAAPDIPAASPSPLGPGGRPPPVAVPPASTASDGTGTPRTTAGPIDTTAAVRTPKVVRSGARRRSEQPTPQSATVEERVSAAVAAQLQDEVDVLAIDTREAAAHSGVQAMDADENVACENVASGAQEEAASEGGGKRASRRAKGAAKTAKAAKAAGPDAKGAGTKAASRRKRPLS